MEHFNLTIVADVQTNDRDLESLAAMIITALQQNTTLENIKITIK